MTSASPRITYVAESFDLLGGTSDVIPATARFNAFQNAIGTGALVGVGPRNKVSVPLSLDKAEWAVTPALGVMVVSIDNFWNGQQEQAELLRVPGGGREEP